MNEGKSNTQGYFRYPYYKWSYQQPHNQQVPPYEGMNIDDVVFVLKYLLIGPQPPLENLDNNLSENPGEDENELDDPNAHYVNHFLEILRYDERDNEETFYVVQHPYSTWGKI